MTLRWIGSFVGASLGPPPMCMPMLATLTFGSGASGGVGGAVVPASPGAAEATGAGSVGEAAALTAAIGAAVALSSGGTRAASVATEGAFTPSTGLGADGVLHEV